MKFSVYLSNGAKPLELGHAPSGAKVATAYRGQVKTSVACSSFDSATEELSRQRTVAITKGWNRPRDGVNRVLAAIIAMCAKAQYDKVRRA